MERVGTFLSGGRMWRRTGAEAALVLAGGDGGGLTARVERWARRLLGI